MDNLQLSSDGKLIGILEDGHQETVDVSSKSYLIKNFPLPLWLEVLITFISAVTLNFTIVAIWAMQQTKKTPGNVKMASTCLLVFNCMATMSYSIRRHSLSDTMRIGAQFIGAWSSAMGFLVVYAMSMDRVVVFQWPYFYLRKMTQTTVNTVFALYLIFFTVVFVFIRVALCYLISDTSKYSFGIQFGLCNEEFSPYIAGSVFCVLILSFAAYIHVIKIAQTQLNRVHGVRTSTKTRGYNTVRQYRSTLFLFVFLINFTFVGFSYMVIRTVPVDLGVKQLLGDIVSLCNNISDSCVYVFWFRECRMNVLIFFSRCFPKLKHKTQTMRLEIYNVIVFPRV